jgi:pimeloyl-ACP methyl ester carboxylesterase
VVGHSTGAQVALEAVLRIQQARGGLALVMAGPTFQPGQRRLRGLIPAALTAYRKDTPHELVVVRDVLRVRTDLVRIVQSARRHPVEERTAGLRVPLTVTAGEADSFATPSWLNLLADRAGGSGRAVVLPGSHNNVFTHRAEFSLLVMEALRAAQRTAPEVATGKEPLDREGHA